VLAAGVILSVLMGILVALLSHVFRRGYISPETLERRLGVPVLASIPDLSDLDRGYGRVSHYSQDLA
jgi:capsular polysaccharide biosynthesis protein